MSSRPSRRRRASAFGSFTSRIRSRWSRANVDRVFGMKCGYTRRLKMEALEDRRLLAVMLSGVPNWIDQGPGPIQMGSSTNPQNNEVGGAIQSIAVDPNNQSHVLIGTVNGGVWSTTNANAATPAAVNWAPISEQFVNMAIGSVAFSPLDNTGSTFFVGTGQFSNSFDVPGGGGGVYRTTNGGTNWTLLGSNLFTGLNIKTVYISNTPRGGS
jgi:hypothetical protein